MSTQNKAFTNARLEAAKKWPYATQAILAMIPVEKPGLGAVLVDRYWRIYFDPQHFEALTKEHRITEIIRNTVKLLRKHYKRFEAIAGTVKATDPKSAAIAARMIWAVSTEIEVNDDLAAEHFQFNQPPLLPSSFGFQKGGTAEAYYTELAKGGKPGSGEASETVTVNFVSLPGSGGAEGDDPNGSSATDGIQRSWEEPLPEDQKKDSDGGTNKSEKPAQSEGKGEAPEGITQSEQEHLCDQVAERIMKSDSRGTVPGFMKRWAEDRQNPQVDYGLMLRRKLRHAAEHVRGAVDYTFRKLSRRDVGLDNKFSLPALHAPVPRIKVIIDTSGSVGQDELSLFLSELGGVLRSMPRRDGVEVLCADARVQSVKKITRVADLDVRGGGGTDMASAIEEAAKSQPRPDVILVFTDGETPWPEHPVPIKTIAILSRPASRSWVVPEWIDKLHIQVKPEHR